MPLAPVLVSWCYLLKFPFCHHRPLTHSQDADKFVKMVEVYVRGNSIKYVTIPEEVLDMVQEEDLSKESECHKASALLSISTASQIRRGLVSMSCVV